MSQPQHKGILISYSTRKEQEQARWLFRTFFYRGFLCVLVISLLLLCLVTLLLLARFLILHFFLLYVCFFYFSDTCSECLFFLMSSYLLCVVLCAWFVLLLLFFSVSSIRFFSSFGLLRFLWPFTSVQLMLNLIIARAKRKSTRSTHR